MGKHIGKKVKLTNAYASYNKGATGTITKDEKYDPYADNVIQVKMDDGDHIDIWAPWDSKAECTWVEESYRIEDIKGKRIAVWCETQEEWDRCRVVVNGDEVDRLDSSTWENYRDQSCMHHDGNSNYASSYANVSYFQRNNYTVIPSSQFITQNQPTMENKEVLQKIEAMEAQIKELKESLNKPVYKVGEYYIITNYDWLYNHSGKKEGEVFKLKEIGKICRDLKPYIWLTPEGPNSGGICSRDVRPATAEEIRKAQEQQPVTLPIGTGTHTVTVEKGKITGPEGKTVAIADIRKWVEIMGGGDDISGWAVSIEEIKVGCCTGVTKRQLQEIASAYQKLNS